MLILCDKNETEYVTVSVQAGVLQVGLEFYTGTLSVPLLGAVLSFR